MNNHEACSRRDRRSQVDEWAKRLGVAWVLIQGGTKKRKASTFGSSKGFESLGTEQRSSGVAVVSRMGFFSFVAESAASRGRLSFV